jgi:predicted NAD-dependent protein-ADP-ribosyltransferase YbiA (DUF1768 family)
MDCISFTKIDLPYGWLSNMSAHPVECFGSQWRTAEALFQALRFSDIGIREYIRSQRSPMGAKLAAKSRKSEMTVDELSDEDVRNMAFCIRLKAQQHESIANDLICTGDVSIFEDVTTRADRNSAKFWGAELTACGWKGQNKLGRLWMELRAELSAHRVINDILKKNNINVDTHICATMWLGQISVTSNSRSATFDKNDEQSILKWVKENYKLR